MSANYPTIPESYLGKTQFPPTYQVVQHMVGFFRWRFNKLPVGAYHWSDVDSDSPEQKNSEVFITAGSPIGVEKVGARPAIAVSRAQVAAAGYGHGNHSATDMATGRVIRMDLLPTHVMVDVVSRSAVESERIAFFCFEQVFALREAIVASLPCLMNIGSNITLSPPAPAGSLIDPPSPEAKWYAVQLGIPTFLQLATSTSPMNQRILSGASVNPSTDG